MTETPPLAGITVLDFTWVLAGPFATRILGDLGATVIKVQRPETGAGQVNNNETPHFKAWNRNKLGIAIDLNSPAGRGEIAELLRDVDVVIDNFSARVMPNWGFDFDDLLAINPRIVAVSMSGFGRTGPWRDRVSYGPTLQALSGVTSLMRYPGDPPTGFGFSYADHVGGTVAAYAVAAGLTARDRSGEGVWIDLAQLEACLYLFGPQLLASVADPEFKPRGNQDWHDESTVNLMLECVADEWVAVTLFSDAELESLFHVVGYPTGEHTPSDVQSVRTRSDSIEQTLSAITKAVPRPRVLASLRAVDIEAQPVQTSADLAFDQDLLGTGFFWSVNSALGAETTDGLPIRFEPPRTLPRMGVPTVGRDQDQVDALRRSRIVRLQA